MGEFDIWSFFVTAAFVAFSICTKLIYDWLAVQKKVDELEKEKTQSELSLLKAQMNPHFLFNSINSIYGHIDRHNNVARSMLLQFSDMLRYQLYECNTERIDIDKEVTYLNNFVALQKMRKNEKLKVRLCFEGKLTGYEIAPLLFIPFVENAFKYVSGNAEKDNLINIQLKESERVLTFTCINSKDSFKTSEFLNNGGIGINNVKRRLHLLYPNRHELNTDNNEDIFKVVLNINL